MHLQEARGDGAGVIAKGTKMRGRRDKHELTLLGEQRGEVRERRIECLARRGIRAVSRYDPTTHRVTVKEHTGQPQTIEMIPQEGRVGRLAGCGNAGEPDHSPAVHRAHGGRLADPRKGRQRGLSTDIALGAEEC